MGLAKSLSICSSNAILDSGQLGVYLWAIIVEFLIVLIWALWENFELLVFECSTLGPLAGSETALGPSAQQRSGIVHVLQADYPILEREFDWRVI